MNVVILGNGIAGNTAASTIKKVKRSTKVTLISEERVPLYSACVFPDYISGELERKKVFLKGQEDYQKNGIGTFFGKRATEINTGDKKICMGDEEVGYDRLIIATGSEPRVPPIEGTEKKRVFSLKSIHDADWIKNYAGGRAVVIGSGPIGIELAIALRKRGYNISVVELLDHILPKLLDEKPASLVEEIMRKHQIEIFTGTKVSEVVEKEKVKMVRAGEHEFECDLVLLATGMKPRAELAEKAGIEVGETGGIKVNQQMMTSIDDIYACGDCVETMDIPTGESRLSLLWHTAKLQANVAAYNCLGIPKKYSGSLNFTGIDIFGAYAISSGNTIADFDGKDSEIIERTKGGDNYSRVIITDGILSGIQFVGKEMEKEAGILLSMIKKKVTLESWKRILDTKEFIDQFPWLDRTRYFLGSGANPCK